MEPLECKACGKELRPWSRCCDKPRIAVRIAGAFDTEGELISWADDEVEVAIEGVAIDYDPIKRTVEIRVGVTSENYDDGKLKPAGATTKSGKPAKAAWVQLKVLQARLRGPAGEESPDDG